MRPLIRIIVISVLFALGGIGASGESSATPPGRNGLIVFSSSANDSLQLFTVLPNGSGLRQITHVAGDAANADFSPDGRRIAFTFSDPTSSRIAVAAADGSRMRLLPQPAGVFDDQPSWTPNGHTIYFERFTLASNDDAIWSMSQDGRHQKRVLGPFPAGFVTDPNLSPDGKSLSFAGFDGSLFGAGSEPARGLFTSDPNGRRIRQIRPYTTDQSIKSDWAPDAQHIGTTENANFLDPDDSANIVTMQPDGTHVRQVTHFNNRATNAFFGSYSPDGRWIVYRIESNGLFGLDRVHPDGTDVQTILPLSTFRPSLIDWGSAVCGDR